jgi:glyoxylase-like metal-dependent hydrolase (beta-lactamase superfamily II)
MSASATPSTTDSSTHRDSPSALHAALQPLVQSRTIGTLRVHAIQAGGQQLDGGAMFGVVPKPLWERRIPADARNRIPLGMRCLLIEHPAGPVLIDTGAGNKENAKFLDIYGIENGGANGRTALEDGLAQLGYAPGDIALVINTHLHFDHAGGNSYLDADGAVQVTFPNARYVVQRGEYEYAKHTNERTAASYFERNFEPSRITGQLDLIDGDREIVAGIHTRLTPGHTPFHQSLVIESAGETAIYLGDVIPTHAHLPLPWIMGYDVEPLVTLESKRRLLADASANSWTLIFEHDASVPWGRVRHDGKAYVLHADSD